MRYRLYTGCRPPVHCCKKPFRRGSVLRVRFHSTAKMAHAKARSREGGSGGGPLVGRQRPDWRLRGFAAYLIRVPGRFRALEKGADVGVRAGEGVLSPLRGWFFWGTEPSAHALGYRLTALRAWGHGLGRAEAAQVHRDRTRFFSVSSRYRCRCRSRYRRARRGVAGRVHRPPGACRFGGFVGWEQCPFATFCDFCGQPPVIEAKGAPAKPRRREEGRGGGSSFGDDGTREMRPGGFQTGGPRGTSEWRRQTPWRLRGFAASLIRVPGRFRALEKGADVGVRAGEGVLSPLRGWFSWGDGTQRSRAGLSSGGPPGLGPRLGSRSYAGASGSNPVLPREISIPMPIPIPTRDARVCRTGSSSAGGRVGSAVSSDGNSVLLRLSVIFAANLLDLRPGGLTRRTRWWPQPRCGWFSRRDHTQGCPRSSANPGLGVSTPLALEGGSAG
jgi:hypothetical protein